MLEKLQNEGIYANTAVFPTVILKRSGVRFTITNHHTNQDIEKMVQTLAYYLPIVLTEENSSIEEIKKFFKPK